MTITVGITTWARPDLLETMAASLAGCEGISQCNVRVYDDASPYWDTAYLEGVFPWAREIVRRDENLGADGNMRQMFVDFLSSGDDLLIVADSDLIFRPDMISTAERVIGSTDGYLSVYNSAVHPSFGCCAADGVSLVLKESVGAAGSVMTRSVVERIIANVPASRSFDWDWSRYLASNGVRLFVTEESLAQHIGVHGQNSSSFSTEYGLNFFPGSHQNEVALARFFEQLIRRKDEVIKSYRVFKPLRYPRRSLKILSGRIVSALKKLAAR